MSWLGKILTFLVLIASLVWVYFTVTTYVTRTNWKARADSYEKALKDSEAARLSEQKTLEGEVAKMARLLKAEQDRATELNANYDKLAADSKKGNDDYNKLLANATDADVREKLLIAGRVVDIDEVKRTRDRNSKLEDDAVKLVLAKENAVREQLRAENEAKLQKALAEDNAGRVLILQAQVTELRQSGGGGGATVIRSIEKAPAPLPDGIRGIVTRASNGDFVEISIGIDAGLEPGSKLDIYRLSEGKHLGTLVIQGTSLRPKEAIAAFRPARGVPISQLRPDELPRKGDNVGIVRIVR